MEKANINYENFIFSYKEYETLNREYLKWHIHPFYELLYILDGNINYIIENKQYKLVKGDLLLIPPAKYHCVYSINVAPYRRYCINFLDDFPQDNAIVNEVFKNFEYLKLSDSPIEKFFELFTELAPDMPQNKHELMCKSLLNAILLQASCSEKENKPQTTQIISQSCQNIIDYINVHLTSIADLDQIAEHFFFSKSHINHMFKKELNLSPMQFIRNKRVLLAQKLINSGKKPKEACFECGFGNYVSFYRCYKQCFGVSPAMHITKRKEN